MSEYEKLEIDSLRADNRRLRIELQLAMSERDTFFKRMIRLEAKIAKLEEEKEENARARGDCSL